jgi:hypothetical protein
MLLLNCLFLLFHQHQRRLHGQQLGQPRVVFVHSDLQVKLSRAKIPHLSFGEMFRASGRMPRCFDEKDVCERIENSRHAEKCAGAK